MSPVTYTVPEAMKALGISRTQIYRLIGAGRLKAHKLGSRTLIKESELLAFLDGLPAMKSRAA